MYQEICPNIIGVGVADSDLEFFENQYPLTSGISYNSYVICGGNETAVIDSVDIRATDRWLSHVAAAAPRGVDYLIIQHMEPDHSASIAAFMERYPKAVLIASAPALKILGQFFPEVDFNGRTRAVSEGEILKVGDEELQFFGAPMIHWPEVIFTYHKQSGSLFTADAFGAFGTDGTPPWPDEARRYYANIVGKYGPQAQKALLKLGALPALGRLCPLHGPVLTEGKTMSDAIEFYNLWSRYEPELPEGVLVAYASIYGNTARAALNAASQLEEHGVEVATIDLCRRDVSFAVAEAFKMGRIICAAPTYDAGIFPAMHDFLYHLQMKGLSNRRFGLIENGSWAPCSGRLMAGMINNLRGCEITDPTVTIRSACNSETATRISDLIENLLK